MRLASIRTWLYLSSIRLLTCPAIAMMVESDVPPVRKQGDGAVPQIMETETRKPAFFLRVRQADLQLFDVRSRVESSDGVADDSLAAECELGAKAAKT